jgi:hypothetical protein
MIVISKGVPGRFEVQSELRGAESLDQEDLIKKLQNELGLDFEFLTSEAEEELENFREFKQHLQDLLKCDFVKDFLSKIVKGGT